MRIKTWRERCEEHPDHEGIVTEQMIRNRMQEEIDELRQAIAEAENQYAAKAAALAHLSDRIQIDPKTGNVSIGSKCEAEVKWDASAPLVMTPHPAFQKREWVGLTDEEKEKLVEAFYGTDIQRLEAVEAKLKEKNSG